MSRATLPPLAAVLGGLGEAVVITDVDGVIVFVNLAAIQVSGYSRDELVGTSPRVLRSGMQPEQVYRDLWQTIRAGSTWSGQLVNRRKDGSLWTEAATIAPIRDGDRTTHYIKVARDVSGELEIERQVRNQQRLETVGALAAGMAHEINNVLGVVLGFIELSVDVLDEDHPARTELERAVKAVDRGAGLLREVLWFSRAEDGERQPLSLTPLLKEALRMLQGGLGAGVELVQEIDAPDAKVLGDPLQLRELVAHLVMNAASALEEGGGTVVVRVQEPEDSVTGEYLEIEVRDDGVGMPEEVLARAFDPFFSTRSHLGARGLGLSACLGIVRGHSGTILLESEPQRGTVARVRLPQYRPQARLSVSEPRRDPDLGGRVLLVDDEVLLLAVLTRTLEAQGIRVEAFSDPQEAVRRIEGAEDQDFDLMLADLTMPHLDGIGLAQRFKARFPGKPVVIQTGFGDDPRFSAPEASCVDRVLYKPLRRGELMSALREVLPTLPAAPA